LEKRAVTRKSAERRRDEAVVKMLTDRMEYSSAVVAVLHGVSAEYVRTATGRVRADDLEYSGEPAGTVLAAYPWSNP
jgi:hypothetical protein